ncbi:hypothetical protein LY78DRAFT_292272 [Colletotrichum sublineola]|nr:hypothetical protein LY78DRAFT_292272 [Colletotrichum sublineola]
MNRYVEICNKKTHARNCLQHDAVNWHGTRGKPCVAKTFAHPQKLSVPKPRIELGAMPNLSRDERASCWPLHHIGVYGWRGAIAICQGCRGRPRKAVEMFAWNQVWCRSALSFFFFFSFSQIYTLSQV